MQMYSERDVGVAVLLRPDMPGVRDEPGLRDACAEDVDSEPRGSVRSLLEGRLDHLALQLEKRIGCDVLMIIGPIHSGLDSAVKDALESRVDAGQPHRALAVILQTDGGVIEVVERMVNIVRRHYEHVTMIVPDCAMSAGTVFALSSDRIMMDYFSVLGPVDPQIERGGSLVPALSYLVQMDRLRQRSREGTLTSLDMAMARQLDLAEMHKFELARDLSETLLRKWLVSYKLRHWVRTETRGLPVTDAMREQRAAEVAKRLTDHQYWLSHGRPIPMQTLRDELNLLIDDLDDHPRLKAAVQRYHLFALELMGRECMGVLVHTFGHCVSQ